MAVLEREFRRLKKLAEGALSQLGHSDVFATVPGEGNSVAIVMKHMSGNMLSRWTDFLTIDGEKPDRARDSEFVLTSDDSLGNLRDRWERGSACLFAVLDSLEDADLARTVYIRREAHTVLQAIARQLTHYAYHTGQIVHVARCLVGPSWRTLSVAKGESEVFNRNPRSYLERDA